MYGGSATARFGGESGVEVTVSAGDVVVIPAGVGHKAVEASADLGIVGAYPAGTSPDLCRGARGERPGCLDEIARVRSRTAIRSTAREDPCDGTGCEPPAFGRAGRGSVRGKRHLGIAPPSCDDHAMQCPFCDEQETRVVDSRLALDGAQVRRRRECTSCRERFTTYEAADVAIPRIVKNDGTRAPFDERKLRQGMVRASEKRPVAGDAIEAAIGRIKRWLIRTGEREIDSRAVGEAVMEALRDLDQVAYVRFASVYRKFEDVSEFRDEVERLENEPPPEARRSQIPLIPDD